MNASLALLGGNGKDRSDMAWQDQVKQDMANVGTEEVLDCIMQTCRFTDDRNLPTEAKSALKWNGYCWWAMPRSIAVIKDELRLIDGLYFRAWVCELDGVKIDGHIFVNEGSGCCQICGL